MSKLDKASVKNNNYFKKIYDYLYPGGIYLFFFCCKENKELLKEKFIDSELCFTLTLIFQA